MRKKIQSLFLLLSGHSFTPSRLKTQRPQTCQRFEINDQTCSLNELFIERIVNLIDILQHSKLIGKLIFFKFLLHHHSYYFFFLCHRQILLQSNIRKEKCALSLSDDLFTREVLKSTRLPLRI